MTEIPPRTRKELLLRRAMKIDIIVIGEDKLDRSQGISGARLLPDSQVAIRDLLCDAGVERLRNYDRLVFVDQIILMFPEECGVLLRRGNNFLFCNVCRNVPVGME